MTASKSSEIVNELIKLISQPSFKRSDHEIALVLPWLKKRSQLLQSQDSSVVSDIVKNCSFLTCQHDDVIIKQGDRGDCYYIVLRGAASVYIDPKMTGETMDETASLKLGAKMRKKKRLRNIPEPEDSMMSEMGKKKHPLDTESMLTEMGKKNLPSDPDVQSEPPASEVVVSGEEEEPEERRPPKALVPLNRDKFGKYIISYTTGKAFGELALVNKDSFRNASVIADEETDLMVIDQDLFDRSLRVHEEARYMEIRQFIDDHPFFHQMSPRFRRLLEMSLRKESYIFDTNIVRQGDPVSGLHFIVSGGAKIIIEPKKHKKQYLHMWPFEAGMDALSREFEHLREARRAAILRRYEDPAVWESRPEELVIRRTEGYAAIEKAMKERHISLCTVQAKEVVGDVETLLGLDTYMQTVRCTANTECFILDTKNFDRLIGKKNNTQTTDIMRAYVINKLATRMNMRNADLIPLLGYLHQKLTEQTLPPEPKLEPFKTSKALPDVEEEMQHLIQYFKEGREVVLIRPRLPGVVYYKELCREKARNRELQRIKRESKMGGDGIKFGTSSFRRKPPRKPRSMLQIRESLRLMMEAEVIEMENKKAKKLLQSKSQVDTLDGSSAEIEAVGHSTPRPDSDGEQQATEDRAMRNIKRTYLPTSTFKPVQIDVDSDPQETATHEEMDQTGSIGDVTHKQNSETDLPKPVLVTEISKSQKELTLPAIREETSQDEITLHSPGAKQSTPRSENAKQKVSSKRGRGDQKSSPSPTHSTSTVTSIRSKYKSPSPQLKTPKTKTKSPSPQHKLTSPSPRQKDTSPSPKPRVPVAETEISPPYKTGALSERKKPTANARHDFIPQFPSLGQGAAPRGRAGDTPLSTSMSFVNQRIHERLLRAAAEDKDPGNTDVKIGEPSLANLENKIQAFHVKYGKGDKTKNLPHLKRYKLDLASSASAEKPEPPRPGGRVWVERKLCKFSHTEYLVKDHRHVRYRMLDTGPRVKTIHRSSAVVKQLLKTADLS